MNGWNNRALVIGILALVIGVAVIGCSGNGSGGSAPVVNPVAEKTTQAVITGNRVDFGKTFSGLDSVGIQVRLSNVPAGFAPTVKIKTTAGLERVLAPAAVGFGGVALAYGALDLFEVAPFASLEFSELLPPDAVVEVFDGNGARALASGVRPGFIGFRKRFDINNDQKVNTSDLALVLAWTQTSRSTDLALIKARSLEIYSAVSGSVATLPAVMAEDLNADAAVDTKDVALAMAWIQVGRVTDATLVYNRAREISTQVTAPPGVFPFETISLVIPNLNEIDLGGTVKMQFAGIPSGTFFMGGDAGNRLVTISKPFLMGIFEVTQEQYVQVMQVVNPSYFKPNPKRPVEQVSWNHAVQFCNVLSDQQGLARCYSFVGTETYCDYHASGYRLPTEAEWEYSCRAGSRMNYYWGENIDGDYCWYGANSSIGGTVQTHDVGLKRPNLWGLFDMSGDVWEWCQDWYATNSSTNQVDPTGPATGTTRVLRGGSWHNPDSVECRSGYRDYSTPSNTSNHYGFRICRLRP